MTTQADTLTLADFRRCAGHTTTPAMAAEVLWSAPVAAPEVAPLNWKDGASSASVSTPTVSVYTTGYRWTLAFSLSLGIGDHSIAGGKGGKSEAETALRALEAARGEDLTQLLAIKRQLFDADQKAARTNSGRGLDKAQAERTALRTQQAEVKARVMAFGRTLS